MSASIWQSQAAASNSANQARNNASSSADKLLTAASISFTVLITNSINLRRFYGSYFHHHSSGVFCSLGHISFSVLFPRRCRIRVSAPASAAGLASDWTSPVPVGKPRFPGRAAVLA